jgi:hypothetical protein
MTCPEDASNSEHRVKGFICRHCGCRFRVVEEKIEVTEHGRSVEE